MAAAHRHRRRAAHYRVAGTGRWVRAARGSATLSPVETIDSIIQVILAPQGIVPDWQERFRKRFPPPPRFPAVPDAPTIAVPVEIAEEEPAEEAPRGGVRDAVVVAIEAGHRVVQVLGERSARGEASQ